MLTYALRRLAYAVVLLFLTSSAIFFLTRFLPGNPYDRIRAEMNDRDPKRLAQIPESHWERLDALLGINKPIHEQYLLWLRNIAVGDFGESWSVATGSSVLGIIATRVPYTILLILTATLFALGIALPFGIYSATHPYSDWDLGISTLSYLGMSMPTFWLGVLLLGTFAMSLDWFPLGGIGTPDLIGFGDMLTASARILTLGLTNPQSAGREVQLIADGLWHLVLPTIALAFLLLARWTRFLRTAILEVLPQDYIRTARAKGVRERTVVLKHSLRNALIPLITAIALDVPVLFTSSFIIENIFRWPGIGRLFIDSLRNADWPLLHGLLILNAALIIGANLVADLAYRVVDPRIN